MSDIDHCRGAEQPQGLRRHLNAVQGNAKGNGMVSQHAEGQVGHTQTAVSHLRLVATALFVTTLREKRSTCRSAKNSPFSECRNNPARVLIPPTTSCRCACGFENFRLTLRNSCPSGPLTTLTPSEDSFRYCERGACRRWEGGEWSLDHAVRMLSTCSDAQFGCGGVSAV